MILTDAAREEVSELTWRLIDDELETAQFERLEGYLRDSDEARKLYVEHVWLHSELIWYYQGDRIRERTMKMFDDPLLNEMLSNGGGGDEARQRQQRSEQQPESARSPKNN